MAERKLRKQTPVSRETTNDCFLPLCEAEIHRIGNIPKRSIAYDEKKCRESYLYAA